MLCEVHQQHRARYCGLVCNRSQGEMKEESVASYARRQGTLPFGRVYRKGSGLSTFVLIHGVWHGAWCWDKVAPLLEQAGHEVVRFDLPGHGEDRTPRIR